MKRDDLIHQELGGNKWRKLKNNLIYAKNQQFTTLLTFGGAYSNHIYAVSAAGKLLGFNTIGIIRGERPTQLSATLLFAESQGMQLVFVSRSAYRDKTDENFISDLHKRFGAFHLIPEGGSNAQSLQGTEEIIAELNEQLPTKKIICCACGTGGTLAGLIEGVSTLQTDDKIMGFPVLKKATWMKDEVRKLLVHKSLSNWTINPDYHFGGYAKNNEVLIDFIIEFKLKFGVQLEPVYTGKLMYGLFDLINKDYFSQGTTIVAIHTGGLQGLKGFKAFDEKL